MAIDGGAVVPWTDLLPELCGLVADRLDAFSALRFPTVCKTWFAAYKEAPPGPRSGSPTMLTSGLDVDAGDTYTVYDYEDGVFALRDVATGKSFRAEAEGLRDRCWVGGKDDWLITTDADCNVELLNPVNGTRTRLPSFDTIPGVKKNGDYDVQVEGDMYTQKLQRVVLCQTPAHREGYLAVAMVSRDLLAFTRSGDESWTLLKNPGAEVRIAYADTIVHGSRVVAVTVTGGVYSWDMLNANGTTEPTLLRLPDTYGLIVQHKLAMSSGGRVLLVCLHGERREDGLVRRKIYDGQQGAFEASGIVLYELVEDARSNITWSRVPDIGSDRALFLGANYPFYIAVPPGSKSEDLEANCVYVADMNGDDATVFDLKKGAGNFRSLQYSREHDAFQMPMWFRPTACLLCNTDQAST